MIDSSIETSSGVVLTTGDERVEVRRTDDEEGEEIRWPTPSPGDIVFQSSTSRYFCGQGRSNSPFSKRKTPPLGWNAHCLNLRSGMRLIAIIPLLMLFCRWRRSAFDLSLRGGYSREHDGWGV